MFEPLVVGAKVEVYIKTNHYTDDSGSREMFTSQVMDFGDDCIICTMPVDKGKLIVLEVGNMLETYFYAGKSIYRADCLVSNRGKEGNIFTMELKPQTPLKKFQRREYYRLECSIPVDIVSLTQDERQELENRLAIPSRLMMPEEKGTIIDISGGGLRIFTKRQYVKDAIVVVKFPIEFNGKVKNMELAAAVIASFRNMNDESMYDNRLQFIMNSREDTEDIIKFIFIQQRLMRQKERGL